MQSAARRWSPRVRALMPTSLRAPATQTSWSCANPRVAAPSASSSAFCNAGTASSYLPSKCRATPCRLVATRSSRSGISAAGSAAHAASASAEWLRHWVRRPDHSASSAARRMRCIRPQEVGGGWDRRRRATTTPPAATPLSPLPLSPLPRRHGNPPKTVPRSPPPPPKSSRRGRSSSPELQPS
eukprot:scaffold1046_cov118-Isochrysis_galbana.AAC.9